MLSGRQIGNPSVAALYEDALVYETGSAITSTGALTAYSGAKTGRSPLDKRIVKEEGSEKEVWWGPVNKPMTPDVGSAALSGRARPSKEGCRWLSTEASRAFSRYLIALHAPSLRRVPTTFHHVLPYPF